MVLLLLVGAALRIPGLNNGSPPGLEHDEVANWLIDRAILAGEHGVYFTAAYGHEAGFHYWQTLFVALVGDHALALRLPAALAGLLLVAVVYALVRRLFGDEVALTSAAFLTVLFMPVFYSRLGLRAITLPLMAALALYCFWRGLEARPERAGRWLALAGALAGLALYTYLAARALPFFFIGYLLYLAIWHRPILAGKWGGIALFALLFAVMAWPLYRFLQLNPGAETRVAEVRAPLDALLSGDFRPVLQNGWRILLGFGWRGDPLWRQNVALQPIFAPLTALFFYGGVAYSLWHWRDRRHALLLLWLAVAVTPSLVTIDAPSTIRMINSLAVLTIIPAMVMHNLPRLSPVFRNLSTDWGPVLLISLLIFNVGRTIYFTFGLWPANDEVGFVWQEALTDAAAYIDSQADWTEVAVGGWTPDTMDPPTMALTLQREDVELRHFQPQTSLIIPAATAPAIMLHPIALPLAPALVELLAPAGLQAHEAEDFIWYELPQPAGFTPALPYDLSFGAEIRLLGLELGAGCAAAGACELITVWQVAAPAGGERRLFLHLLDDNEAIVAQADGLDVPAAHWQPGDLILQLLTIPAGPGDDLRLGVYDPLTFRRLPRPDGADSLLFTLP